MLQLARDQSVSCNMKVDLKLLLKKILQSVQPDSNELWLVDAKS